MILLICRIQARQEITQPPMDTNSKIWLTELGRGRTLREQWKDLGTLAARMVWAPIIKQAFEYYHIL